MSTSAKRQCQRRARLRREIAALLGRQPSHRDPPPVPTKIAHYQILNPIGSGATGTVYRARDPRLNRFVAIKMPRQPLNGDRQSKDRIVREATCGATLNHPNIVTVHHLCLNHGGPFMVMELVAGKTLDRLIPKTGFRREIFLDYAAQISAAVAAVHCQGIAHRDLKPANFVITKQGTIKLLDFGLAKVVRRRRQTPKKSLVSPITTEGTILGTVGYMSPEQASGEEVDQRSDIFSLGAVFYEMATGRRAFQEKSDLRTMKATRDNAPRRVPARISPPIARIIRRCLHTDPARRYKNAAELAADLALLARVSRG